MFHFIHFLFAGIKYVVAQPKTSQVFMDWGFERSSRKFLKITLSDESNYWFKPEFETGLSRFRFLIAALCAAFSPAHPPDPIAFSWMCSAAHPGA